MPAIALRVETCRKDFKDSNSNVVYTMTQAWLANATRIDVHGARATIEWKRRGGHRFDGWRVHGIWCKKLASGLASYPEGIEEQTSLLSNGDDRHLGLAARNSQTGQTYLVCTETYWEHTNYEHAAMLLQPGIYDVDVLIEAQGGRTAFVELEIQHGGGTSALIAIQR